MVDMWDNHDSPRDLAEELTGHRREHGSSRCYTCGQKWVCDTVDTAAKAIHKDREDTIRAVRGVVTQYVCTAEQWRYDRMVWAFGLMLGEIPEDTPEPMSPADYRHIAILNAMHSVEEDSNG